MKNSRLSEKDKKELLEMAASQPLRDDFRIIARNRFNPFVVQGSVDLEKYISFLNDYSEFLHHRGRPFQRITTRDMRM